VGGSDPVRRVLNPAVQRAGSLVLDSPGPLFYGLTTLILLAKCGLGVYPATLNALDVARAFPKFPAGYGPNDQWLMTSLAGPALAKLLGITEWQPYAALHGVVVLLAVAALFVFIFRKFGPKAARLSYLALALTTAPVFLLTWLGSYDPFTFALSSFLLLATGWVGTLVLAFLLGMQHFEQGVFVCAALLLLMPKRYISRPLVGASLVGGLVAGKLVLSLYLRSIGVTKGRLDYAVFRGIGNSFQTQLPLVPLWAFAFLGGAWIWLGYIVAKSGRGSAEVTRALLALAMLMVPSLLTFDQNRVFSIISWPVILWLTLYASRKLPPGDARSLAGIGFLTLLVAPAVYVWGPAPATWPVTMVPGGAIAWVVCAIAALLLLLAAPWRPPASAAE